VTTCGGSGVGTEGNGLSSSVVDESVAVDDEVHMRTSGWAAPPWGDDQMVTAGKLQKRG